MKLGFFTCPSEKSVFSLMCMCIHNIAILPYRRNIRVPYYFENLKMTEYWTVDGQNWPNKLCEWIFDCSVFHSAIYPLGIDAVRFRNRSEQHFVIIRKINSQFALIGSNLSQDDEPLEECIHTQRWGLLKCSEISYRWWSLLEWTSSIQVS